MAVSPRVLVSPPLCKRPRQRPSLTLSSSSLSPLSRLPKPKDQLSNTRKAMADKENCARLTRAAKKRAAAGQLQQQEGPLPAAKKTRVVLGELSNLSNVPQNPVSKFEPSKPKCRTKKKEKKPEMTDIDANADDPQMVVPYVPDILKYLRSMEVEPKRRPLPKYIENSQSDISATMRGVLVDWLVEVAEEYKLVSDTLYLTVDYIDRYLSSRDIKRHKLQLVGVSCMLIASKYEEISPPHVEDFCYITDNTYTREEVINMESDILKFLMFEMGNPTVKTFLRRFINVATECSKSPTLQFEFLCNYLAELCLLDYGCVQFLPSQVAAAVVFVARLTIHPKRHPWSLNLQNQTGYTPTQLEQCVRAIHELQTSKRAASLMAIRTKYKQHKFKAVAELVPPSDIPSNCFEDVKCSSGYGGHLHG